MYQRWQQDGPPQGWVLWKPLSRLMQRVTVKRAGKIVTGGAYQSLVSFPADSTHIPSIWASRQQQTNGESSFDPVSGILAMEIYRDIARDMSVGLYLV